jgi:retinol dehydrogenase-12
MAERSARVVVRDLVGKNALVTGANTGIGKVTARELARRGARVWIGCRSEERASATIQELLRDDSGLALEPFGVDLGELDSVRRAAAAFLASGEPLHLLINNAGVAGRVGLTKDGFELCFGINYLGHFLLTQLLLERLKESAPARIVNVSSTANYNVKGIDFEAVRAPARTLGALTEYAVSKLANVLFTTELARRLEGTSVTSYALHPGVIATDIWRSAPWPIRPIIKWFMTNVEDGATTTLYCATAPELEGTSGRYYDFSREKKLGPVALDAELARRLWDQSEVWTRKNPAPA